ncbi:MAG: aspartyl protease family protein [Euryarchaeota archaeon]|nr:MAG: hypothetical protein C5S48_06385 [ANME-2 cluster archaeon]MEA1865994.1 aspartyl protease family protein [Euryarchaeota archaeon]
MPSFRYRKEYSKLFGTVYRPVAEVYFKDAEGKDLISFMYVDSGADITLLPRELGENLDLTIGEEKIQEISGVGGGSIPVIIKTIEMRIGDYAMNVRVAWSLEEGVPALLGRMDVFNETKVSFIHNETVVFEFGDDE